MLIGPSDHLVIEPFKTSLCSVDGVVGSDVDVPIFGPTILEISYDLCNGAPEAHRFLSNIAELVHFREKRVNLYVHIMSSSFCFHAHPRRFLRF